MASGFLHLYIGLLGMDAPIYLMGPVIRLDGGLSAV